MTQQFSALARRVLLPPGVAAVVFFVAWALIIRVFDIRPFLAPTPTGMLAALFKDFETMMRACLLTGKASISGLLLSTAMGTAVGVVFAQIPLLRRAMYPYAIFLQTVPIVAIAPLLVLWIGNGLASVIAVAFILSLFPIVTNVTAGMTSVPESFEELFRLNHARPWQRFTKLQFPHAIPHLMTGIKISGGLAVIGSIVGEFFVGYGAEGRGLGYMIRQSVEMNRTDRLFAVVFLSTLLGVLIFASVCVVADVVLKRWNQR
jgi:NitT/TauT family transport system permease protein